MHSGGFERTKLTYTRFEDNLTRHRGVRLYIYYYYCVCCVAPGEHTRNILRESLLGQLSFAD